MKQTPIELLAPAKNCQQGMQAILHGADAVYIGGPAFGARAAVGNSIEDIKQLCDFAHQFFARVYVAFNTILSDEEIKQAQTLIEQIYQAGADALIVQDMGILQLKLPPIALHASTQADIRTPEKVLFLQSVGFSQVVLARELDLTQIKAINDRCSVQLEAFIHGALCVSYSGQCYISQAVTGRSANRGECSQLCRLPATLSDQQGDVLAKNKHLLSLKDLNQSDNLELMLDAGIRSFKIEGRLKDLHYVKNVTAWYRQKLDAIIAKRPEFVAASHGRCRFSFKPDPMLSFNRGTSDYFIHGRKRQNGQVEIAEYRSPKPIGIDAGKITKIGLNYVEVSSPLSFNNGDGVSFFNQKGELQGMRINRVEGHRLYPAKMPNELTLKMRIFRNHHQAFAAQLGKDSVRRKIPIKMRLVETNEGIALELQDLVSKVRVELAMEKQRSNSPEKNNANINKALNKLGNSLFDADVIRIELSQPWFIAMSQLNQLRREAVEALTTARAHAYKQPTASRCAKPKMDYEKKRLNFSGNVYNQQAKEFYLSHGVDRVEPAFEQAPPEKSVPLMLTKHCLRYSYKLCPKEVAGIKAEPMQLELGGKLFTLRFDCNKCEMQVMGSPHPITVPPAMAPPRKPAKTKQSTNKPSKRSKKA